MRLATITGWGRCVPPAVLSNADFESLIDTSDEWITSRTGIKERRISHVETSDLATVAGARALAAAGIEPQDVDLLLVATCSPDRLVPSAAAYVQAKLGVVNAAVMDLNAACTGFVYGMATGSSMIGVGAVERVLLVGVEKLTAFIDLEDRSTAVLFGDGAGAVVLEPSDGDHGVLATHLGADGNLSGILTVPGTGTEDGAVHHHPTITMDGREVFRHAVVRMGEAAETAVSDAGLTLDDVDVLIPHQANVRIIDATARRMQLRPEQVYVNIASYGNTSAASIPIALSEAVDEGRITPGDDVVFVAFGGGLTWGAAVVRWGDRVAPLATTELDLPPTDKTGRELLLERQAHR